MRSAGVTSASSAASTASLDLAPRRPTSAASVQARRPSGVPVTARRCAAGPAPSATQGRRAPTRSRPGTAAASVRRSRGTGTPAAREQDSTSAPRSSPAQLGAGRERAERDADRADAGRGQPRHHEVGPVGVEQRRRGCPGPRPAARRPRASAAERAIGVGVGQRVVVARPRSGLSPSRGDRAAGAARDGEREAVAGVDRWSAITASAFRGETAGRSPRSPATARIVGRRSTARRRRAARAIDVMRRSADGAVDLEPQLGEQGVGRR